MPKAIKLETHDEDDLWVGADQVVAVSSYGDDSSLLYVVGHDEPFEVHGVPDVIRRALDWVE